MTGTRWESIDPARECSNPDGHQMLEEQDLCDPAPRVWCVACGAEATVFVIPTEPNDGHEHQWVALTTYEDAWGDGQDRYQCINCATVRLVAAGSTPES